MRPRFPWMGWWYAAIALGFALLALQHLVTGDKFWLVGVRLIIAVGFALLAAMEFKARKLKR
jgi:hypothetical protein